MGNVAGAGANFFDTPVFNATIPKEGPKALQVTLPFDPNNQLFLIDLTLTQTQHFMSVVQSVFVDNADNDLTLSIVVQGLPQRVIVPGKSQAYLPLLCPKPTQIQVTRGDGSDLNTVLCNLVFMNVPVPATVYSASNATTTPLSNVYSYVDRNFGLIAGVVDGTIDVLSPLKTDVNSRLLVNSVGAIIKNGFQGGFEQIVTDLQTDPNQSFFLPPYQTGSLYCRALYLNAGPAIIYVTASDPKVKAYSFVILPNTTLELNECYSGYVNNYVFTDTGTTATMYATFVYSGVQ